MQVWAVMHQVSTHAGKPSSRPLTDADHLGIHRGNAQVGAPGHFGGQGQPAWLYSFAEGHLGGPFAQWVTANQWTHTELA